MVNDMKLNDPGNQDSVSSESPSKSNTLLREAFKAAHNRFHGRYNTHGEVAVKSQWTPQELKSVQIQDEELFYDEILALFQVENNKLLTELLEHETTVTRREFTSLRMAEVKTHAFEAVPTSVIKGYMK
jgi:hypothetical protein